MKKNSSFTSLDVIGYDILRGFNVVKANDDQTNVKKKIIGKIMIFVSMLLHLFVVFIYCYYYLHVRDRLYINT
ncbi:hypothetical protein [Ehrlichia ruminantium]|uniref:hypothetical protein n=1 Tax=Ehrlichia ruminantium TaxID=779 RepID=UPI0015DC69A3|nr:hypothetical protein [Ehrlichia ruminantium]QLK50817.1 hypothetical protein FDZ68_04120 [Ehrlichia ruminantium]QLK51739.1 hypothetical protein FDZ66_04120 [Ehrlichia ruminantium]